MPACLLLRLGDRLPSVATVQILLNRAMPRSAPVVVDGVFGHKTYDAVVAFQKQAAVAVDGLVGPITWAALSKGQAFQVVDVCDATEDDDQWEAAELRAAGADPIVVYGQCFSLSGVARQILERGRRRKIVLLRFHGHGSPGVMGAGDGKSHDPASNLRPGVIDLLIEFFATAGPSVFCNFGSVELHGCRTGQGVAGRALLKGLCVVWGVPITAGIGYQYGGGRLRFEGVSYTVCPNGMDLRAWCACLPEASENLVSSPG
jgi:hypothetical protein